MVAVCKDLAMKTAPILGGDSPVRCTHCQPAFIVSVIYPMKSPIASKIDVIKLITTFMPIEGVKAGIFSAFW